MKAMLLAAGVGTRLDPLTTQLPKPLVPIANIPVMEHILALLARHGFTDIAANLHYLPQKLIDYFGDGSKFGVKLHFKYEEKLSGDAGGVRACRNFFDQETFLVIMGDLLTDADLTSIMAEHKMKKALASIAIKEVEDVSHLGVVVTNKDGFINGFQEKPRPEAALSNLASTGIYVLEPEVFEHIPKEGEYGFGRQLFPKLVELGLPVLGIQIASYWSDVGTINQYRQSNFDAIEQGIKLKLPGQITTKAKCTMWLGDNSLIENGAHLEGYIMLGNNTRIANGATVKGRVIIGDNCTIEDNVELIDSVIWSDTHIESSASVCKSVIGSNCRLSKGTKYLETASVSIRSPEKSVSKVKVQ